jgi:NADH-quinone oxidoreductase subunit C
MNLTRDSLAAAFGSLLGVTPEPPVVSADPPADASTPAAKAPPPPPPPTAPGVRVTDPALKGYDLDVALTPDRLLEAAARLDQEGFALDTITGVDWPEAGEMEVVYDFFHPLTPLRVMLRMRVPRDQPEVPSLISLYGGANWHERETHDFFGIRFTGHPKLTPFLLPEDADFHPLRKDYAP